MVNAEDLQVGILVWWKDTSFQNTQESIYMVILVTADRFGLYSFAAGASNLDICLHDTECRDQNKARDEYFLGKKTPLPEMRLATLEDLERYFRAEERDLEDKRRALKDKRAILRILHPS